MARRHGTRQPRQAHARPRLESLSDKGRMNGDDPHSLYPPAPAQPRHCQDPCRWSENTEGQAAIMRHGHRVGTGRGKGQEALFLSAALHHLLGGAAGPGGSRGSSGWPAASRGEGRSVPKAGRNWAWRGSHQGRVGARGQRPRAWPVGQEAHYTVPSASVYSRHFPKITF